LSKIKSFNLAKKSFELVKNASFDLVRFDLVTRCRFIDYKLTIDKVDATHKNLVQGFFAGKID
jgi:hypothetical protein